MPDKALVAGVAIVAVGAIAVAAIAWNGKKNLDAERAARTQAAKVRVSTTWGTPRAAVGGAKDSLGLTVYPEMYEMGRLDKEDSCAWQGCIGELDANGNCTGCPQM